MLGNGQSIEGEDDLPWCLESGGTPPDDTPPRAGTDQPTSKHLIFIGFKNWALCMRLGTESEARVEPPSVSLNRTVLLYSTIEW